MGVVLRSRVRNERGAPWSGSCSMPAWMSVYRTLLVLALAVISLGSCALPAPDAVAGVEGAQSNLTAAQRRVRAGRIRDAAAANGMTQGYLLAGIADAETNMSQCWSELTWACQGPNSADCGGGPVVAGAGDGACSLRQGGLGMFQFDAGTYDDTLAREGSRVLSIDGNVAAAVDFVVAMVIRSTYVPGVTDRAGAIDWMNGVRTDNARFDPWIKTVTRYYNGCQPTYSCWSSRYAHYRDNTTGVYAEMGADFWSSASDYSAAWVSQSFPLAAEPFELAGGDSLAGNIVMRNTGTVTWTPGVTFLAPTPRDAPSALAAGDWVNPGRAATVSAAVAPGGTATFSFSIQAPDAPGVYDQTFGLVQEGVAWFADRGGPRDDQLEVKLTVTTAAPACAAGTEFWACDGLDRVRCSAGVTEREHCDAGCTVTTDGDDTCRAGLVDADGDGWDAARDCDDADPARHPTAADICGDGIDQDCNGTDLSCDSADGGMIDADGGVATPRSGGLSGGCAVTTGSAETGGALRWLLLPALLWCRRPNR